MDMAFLVIDDDRLEMDGVEIVVSGKSGDDI